MSDLSESEVYSYYSQLLMQADKTAFIGYWQNQPAFLFELYDPALHPVREHYSVEEGDCGMHLLIAPTNLPQSGFSLAVMHTLMQFIFLETYIQRVIVEPDSENKKIHRLNNRVGFTHIKPAKLENKCAYWAICSRNAFFRAFEREILPVNDTLNGQNTVHLTPYYWEKANRFLLKKSLLSFLMN